MTNTIELRDKASALRKSKDFNLALPLYEELWKNRPNERNEWDGWGYASCLRKVRRAQEAEQVCRDTLKIKSDFAYARNELAWCLYDLYIKKSDEEIARDEQPYLRAAKEVTSLVRQDQFSAFAKTILHVSDYLKSKPNPRAQDRYAWLSQLDPAQLSTDTFQFTDATGAQRTLASDKERCFASLTDVLVGLTQWEKCISIGEQALKQIQQFHYDNDIWIRRRIAIAKGKLGRRTEAIADLRDLLVRKKEFFIQHDLAELLAQEGLTDEAFSFAAQAALGHGEPQMKLGVFELLGQLLRAADRPKEAAEHYALMAAVRLEHNWPISSDLANVLSEAGVQIDKLESSHVIIKRLTPVWAAVAAERQERFTGRITEIREKFGFVSTQDRRSYFFRLSEFKGPRRLLVAGQEVTFALEDGFDKKKSIPAKNAVNLQPA